MQCLLIFSIVVGVAWAQKNGNQWNPFQSNLDFSKFPGTPAGFGQFPTFGGNTGFGSFGSGFGGNSNSNNNNDGSSSSSSSSLNRNRAHTGGDNSFGSFGAFPDFSKSFGDFQSSFANNFGGFGNSGFGGFGSSNRNPGSSSSNNNNGDNSNGGDDNNNPTLSPATPASTQATRAPIRDVDTSRPVPVAVPVAVVPTDNGNNGITQSFTITSRNCSGDNVFVGIAPHTSDACGSVECTCFKGLYLCYSTCNPPTAGQTCLASVASNGGADVCPTYTDCAPYQNATLGDAQMFRCSGGPVHPSICWLYEIVFGKLTEPLGFFESVQSECGLASQCVCQNGFVQAAQLRAEDFKTPANNLVYPRAQQGNKGTIAQI